MPAPPAQQASLTGRRTLIPDDADGQVTFDPHFLTPPEAASLYQRVQFLPGWRPDTFQQNGEIRELHRKINWMADGAYDYDYSGGERTAAPWQPLLRALRRRVQNATGERFSSCLMNYYPNGAEGMGWHSDEQKHMEPDSSVAIVSLGAARWFRLRRIDDHADTHRVMATPGSLLVMQYPNQDHWQHCIPKMMRVGEPRVSITFRTMRRAAVADPEPVRQP